MKTNVHGMGTLVHRTSGNSFFLGAAATGGSVDVPQAKIVVKQLAATDASAQITVCRYETSAAQCA